MCTSQIDRMVGLELGVCWYLWCALSLSDYVVQIFGYVCVHSAGQIPWLTDPVVIFPPEKQVFIK